MPPAAKEVKSWEDFSAIVLQMHSENTKQIEALRQILLDFNERLVANEMAMRHADQARLMLLDNLNKLIDKIDTLRDLPREITTLTKNVEELETTVKAHDKTFQQIQGGWAVARWGWIILAGVISFAVSFATQWVMRGGTK